MNVNLLDRAAAIVRAAVDQFRPTHIVSMVSGGKDSACSDQVARDLGIKIDFVIHGNTGCGIQETSEFVRDTYAKIGDFVEASAGMAYEEYVMRKGFFGKGIAAHGFAYRVLKATPFRKAISAHIRKRQRNVRVMLINGARKDESFNRQKNLAISRADPAAPGNLWVNVIHDFTQSDRDNYLATRGVPINPVAKELCRSGECMCGTMQSPAERIEAALLYPRWGKWLDDLEREVVKRHGFGWGDAFPRKRDERQTSLFQPMCTDCVAAIAAQQRQGGEK